MTVLGIVLLVLISLLAARVLRCANVPPHFRIGSDNDWYMHRWYVIPRNRWFNIYLHNVLRDDDDRALHDHPWWSISVVLRGGYWEVMPKIRVCPGIASWALQAPSQKRVWRAPGSIVLRQATDAHRLVLGAWHNDDGREHPTLKQTSWSLFITGPNVRTWGFWCPKGWRPWREFVADAVDGKGNSIGAGCEGLQ